MNSRSMVLRSVLAAAIAWSAGGRMPLSPYTGAGDAGLRSRSSEGVQHFAQKSDIDLPRPPESPGGLPGARPNAQRGSSSRSAPAASSKPAQKKDDVDVRKRGSTPKVDGMK
jgi:hypothetical protein